MPTAAPIAIQKSQLRIAVLRARRSLSAVTRELEATRCHQALFALPAFESAQSILCTASFSDEISTRPIIDKALSMGKRVALPRVDSVTNELQLFWFDAQTVLEKSQFGIDEPALDSVPASNEDLSLILIPGIAFDGSGNRLGYGRGYYDKLLRNTDAHTVAIAFMCQVVSSVPTESHDAQIGTLITAK